MRYHMILNARSAARYTTAARNAIVPPPPSPVIARATERMWTVTPLRRPSQELLLATSEVAAQVVRMDTDREMRAIRASDPMRAAATVRPGARGVNR